MLALTALEQESNSVIYRYRPAELGVFFKPVSVIFLFYLPWQASGYGI